MKIYFSSNNFFQYNIYEQYLNMFKFFFQESSQNFVIFQQQKLFENFKKWYKIKSLNTSNFLIIKTNRKQFIVWF